MSLEILSPSKFSTCLVPASSETDLPRCEIVLHGAATGKTLAGAVLTSAVKWNRFYLMFITDGVDFEDWLSIYMLTADLQTIDSARIGTIYGTGTFSGLRLEEPNIVFFRFLGGIDWKLELFSKPVVWLPFFSSPTGVYRRVRFMRHFQIHGKPLPEPSR